MAFLNFSIMILSISPDPNLKAFSLINQSQYLNITPSFFFPLPNLDLKVFSFNQSIDLSFIFFLSSVLSWNIRVPFPVIALCLTS